MKKLFFFFSVLLFSLITSAQITKNNWLAGGSGSLFAYAESVDKQGNVLAKSTTASLNPDIGYFFADKFAAGIQLDLNYQHIENTPDNYGVGGGPFVRYYFLKQDKLINIFAEGSFRYYVNLGKGRDPGEYGKGYYFKAGPAIFFNNSVALEVTLNYLNEYLSTSKNNYRIFSVGIGFQIHLEK
jgi:hypothetical protein